MADPAQIAEIYSRIPALRPPPSIYWLRNADIGAERLYDASHGYNASLRTPEAFHIFGMHKMGTPFVVVAGDAPTSTWIHEGVHYNGVRSERVTYATTALLLKRAQFNLGLLRRPVHYEPVPVTGPELQTILHDMGMENPGAGNVELVHLVYRPG